jgi:hypothetical protein
MNATTEWDFNKRMNRIQPAKEQFRDKFQRSLRACVRRGFSVEESFGMIWVETWEDINLSQQEEAELYEELLRWAKTNVAEQCAPSMSHLPFAQRQVSF